MVTDKLYPVFSWANIKTMNNKQVQLRTQNKFSNACEFKSNTNFNWEIYCLNNTNQNNKCNSREQNDPRISSIMNQGTRQSKQLASTDNKAMPNPNKMNQWQTNYVNSEYQINSITRLYFVKSKIITHRINNQSIESINIMNISKRRTQIKERTHQALMILLQLQNYFRWFQDNYIPNN